MQSYTLNTLATICVALGPYCRIRHLIDGSNTLLRRSVPDVLCVAVVIVVSAFVRVTAVGE